MQLTSPQFSHEGSIPARFSQYGDNHSPPLEFKDVPPDASSIALIVDDPDATRGTFTHWVIFNIDARVDEFLENHFPLHARQGRNDAGAKGYTGPKPPEGEHRYFFRAYALDGTLDVPEGAPREALETAMQGHILAQAELMGLFAKPE